MAVASRKCFNIQSYCDTKVFENIVLSSNKSRPVKTTAPLNRSLVNAGDCIEKEKSNPAKRFRTDLKITRESECRGVAVPTCSAFIDVVQQYIRALMVAEEKKASEIRTQLALLESHYAEKLSKSRLQQLASFQKTKLENSFLASKNQLLKKLETLESSPVVQQGREIGIRYIVRYQNPGPTGPSDEEKLSIISDFKGRFCGTILPPVQQCNTMICQRCEIPMFIRNEDGFLVCKNCGTTEAHSDRVPYVGINNIDDADSTAQSTKKVSNFRDYLHLLQGKKINAKLELDYPAMQDYLETRNLMPSDISVDVITKMLVFLGKRKYIKYMALLESRFGKTPLIQMSLQLENKFCSNFLMLTDPYERHKPASRKHFMSYAYCGWQFCRIEKTPEFFVLFRLLKDPVKIAKQDETFAKICPEIGWTFESSSSLSFSYLRKL